MERLVLHVLQEKGDVMRRISILMSIAAMILTSCAKDSMKEANKGRAIDFRVAAQSRATETTTANLTTFYVTAIDESGSNYFTNAAFTKVDEYFCSSPAYYWPGSEELNFYAYAPSATSLGATVTINKDTKIIEGYAPAVDITDQKDLVTAIATGSKEDEASGVALTFNHQLSQIEIKARNANEGYTYKIKGVRLAQPVAQGDLNLATGEWTLTSSSKAVYDVTYDRVITLGIYSQNLMESEGDNAMLIPQQLVAWNPETDKTNTQKGAYISVYAQVRTAEGARVYPKTEGDDYAWLAVPIDTKWEAGHKYVYTLDFTEGAGYSDPIEGYGSGDEVLGGPIKLTMSVLPWNENNNSDIIGTWALHEMTSTYYRNGTVETETTSGEELYERVDFILHNITFTSPIDFILYEKDENDNPLPLYLNTYDFNGKTAFVIMDGEEIYLHNVTSNTLTLEALYYHTIHGEPTDNLSEHHFVKYIKQ